MVISSSCSRFVLAQKQSGEKPLASREMPCERPAFSLSGGRGIVGGERNAAGGTPAGMKRVIVLALCLIGLIAVAVAAIPFLVSTDLAKRRIAEEIGRLTGRAVSFAGEPRVSFFPHINVELRDISLANPEGMSGDPFLAMDAVVGRVRILPLFLGRTEIAEFRLVASASRPQGRCRRAIELEGEIRRRRRRTGRIERPATPPPRSSRRIRRCGSGASSSAAARSPMTTRGAASTRSSTAST